MFKRVLLAACLPGALWSVALADEGRLTLPQQPDENVELRLQGGEGDLGQPPDVLRVYVGKPDTCCSGKSAIAGTYSVTGTTVSFDPAFDFTIGQSYSVLSLARGGDLALSEFAIGAASASLAPQITAIYPSGAFIPENTLRFYVHFSEPMQPHKATEYIKLVDATGTPDLAAFMSFKQEMWSEDRKRLTLLMDPGRIKRGVAQNRALGPALLAGNRYSIVVEEGWPAARGGQHLLGFRHDFNVSDALRRLPDTEAWNILAPAQASREPLVIKFDRPFDHQLAQTAITVSDENGRSILGETSVEDDQGTWRFEPKMQWRTAKLRITIDARFEDVAGNNFRELLDHAVGAGEIEVDQKVIALDLKPSKTVPPIRTVPSEISE